MNVALKQMKHRSNLTIFLAGACFGWTSNLWFSSIGISNIASYDDSMTPDYVHAGTNQVRTQRTPAGDDAAINDRSLTAAKVDYGLPSGKDSCEEKSLISQLAPAFFPMDSSTGKINFSPSVTSVIIDIGARGSDYLRTLEATNDTTIAVILVDPLPDSLLPLANRVTAYNMRDKTKKWLDPIKKSQAFYVRAAMGEKEGMMDFNIGTGPACGSILKASAENDFWCAKSKENLPTIVLTLKGLLDLIPTTVEIHLKVDAEGADLVVLRGAGAALSRVKTIIHECWNNQESGKQRDKLIHDNECVNTDSIEYMTKTMSDFLFLGTDGLDTLNNLFYVNKDYKSKAPALLRNAQIAKRKFYREVNDPGSDK